MSESEDPQKDIIDKKAFNKDANVSQFVMNLTNTVDNADGQLFPNLYNQIQQDFAENYHISITLDQLGWITTVRSLLQAITTPMWGWWNDKHSRKKVLAFGCLLWGVFTLLMAFSVNFIQLILYRAITGIGLAVIIPTTQSVVADYVPPAKRGKAFGWLGLTQILGIIAGTMFIAIFVNIPSDWRSVFIIWGIISIVLAGLVMLFAKDPIRGQMDPDFDPSKSVQNRPKLQGKVFKEIFSNTTFMIIVIQGVIGSLPWNAILFIVAWFEDIGFGIDIANYMFLFMAVGAAIGNLLGGVIGDWAAKKSPKYGRIASAQFSAAMGVPLAFILFKVIPQAVSSMYVFSAVGFITGVIISWPGTACNIPVFSELFAPEVWGTVYSVDRAFEGSLSALGTIIVAFIASSYFNYQNPQEGVILTSAQIAANAVALGQAILYTTVIPWAVSSSLYTIVYFTYPRDLEKIRKVLEKRISEQSSIDSREDVEANNKEDKSSPT